MKPSNILHLCAIPKHIRPHLVSLPEYVGVRERLLHHITAQLFPDVNLETGIILYWKS